MQDQPNIARNAGRPRRSEAVLGMGALAMALGAFAGHALIPDKVADHYGWVRERWYQREIGAFNAGLAYGIWAYARGRPEDAFLGSWATAAMLMALTRLAAIRSGSRHGVWNIATVAEDAALGIGGFVLLRRRRSGAGAET
jgi:hypothetical protein